MLPSPRREDQVARIGGSCMGHRKFGVEWPVLSNKTTEQANECRNASRPQLVHRQSFGAQLITMRLFYGCLKCLELSLGDVRDVSKTRTADIPWTTE